MRCKQIFLSVLGLSCAVVELSASQKPNVLIFYVDDMGIGDTRVYNPAAPVEMPNLERLAEQGMTFHDAHSQAALCAPSRYSMLSGNYPWRGRSAGGSWHFNGGSQFTEGQKSIADVLKGQGYRSAMFGKVHLGALVPPKDGTTFDKASPVTSKKKSFDWTKADFSKPLIDGVYSLGFDYTYVSYGGIQDPPYAFFENDLIVGDLSDLVHYDGGKSQNDNGTSVIQRWMPGYGMADWKTNEFLPIITEKAIDFLDKHHAQNKKDGAEKPFYIHFCTDAVHVPHTPPNEFMGVKVAGTTGGTRHMDMLFAMDVALGKLTESIAQHGQLDNTLIIFASDNGGLPQKVSKNDYDSNEGLRGYKAQIYEGGHRVPFVIKWTNGKVKANSTSDQLVGVHDLFATLADLTGAQVGEDQGLDSMSFLPVLLNDNSTTLREDMLFQGAGPKERAIRVGEWKLCLDKESKPNQLFNLKQDPKEEDDLINNPEHEKRVQQMHELFVEQFAAPRSTPAF
ncbi:sulfatase family protein [Persicirhabdus sediminis]|uniref:Arylsulfatase n=1 Tax=Persicirhabdus sediminis TaxID=454144 RepID=A0A8J7MF79_9BACT|nr:arylsulfatase [Persicirhabdus sediminis]MBK1791617.1 arylsulfatase [Persicirhabdus sediminis]